MDNEVMNVADRLVTHRREGGSWGTVFDNEFGHPNEDMEETDTYLER